MMKRYDTEKRDWDQTPAYDPERGEPAPESEFHQTVSG